MNRRPRSRSDAYPDGRLKFSSVGKRYARGPVGASHGSVQALDDVNLVIDQGEFVGIVGANGVGKTTLLRVASGIATPDTGEVRRLGKMATVLELGAGLHGDLTGEENIELLAVVLGIERKELTRVRKDVANFSGLGDHLGRRVKHYSAGMLARLSLSIVMHTRPDLLLLDEVLSVGDLEFRQRCLERTTDLHCSGVTIVMVSHDLSMISWACDCAILLEAGRITADGPPFDVIETYLNGPARQPSDTGRVTMRIREPAVSPRDRIAIDVEVELAHHSPDLEVTIEAAMPRHPYAHFDEALDGPLVFGEEVLPAEWTGPGARTLEISLEPSLFPPSVYSIRVVLRARGWDQPLIATDTVRVLGPVASIPTARLEAAWVSNGTSPSRAVPK